MEEKQSNGLAIASMVLGNRFFDPDMHFALCFMGTGNRRYRISSMGSSYYFAGSSWCICRIGRIKKNGQQAGNCKSSLPLLFFLVLY